MERSLPETSGEPPKIIENNTQKIIDRQLDIKLGDFTTEELNQVLKKLKGRKAASLDEIPPAVWKMGKFNDVLLRLCNAV